MTPLERMKTWLKAEDAQLSVENGMLIMLVILMIIGITSILSPGLKQGFDKILAIFETPAATNG